MEVEVGDTVQDTIYPTNLNTVQVAIINNIMKYN